MCATVIQELNNCMHISELSEKQNLKAYQKIIGYQDMIQGKILSRAGLFLIH